VGCDCCVRALVWRAYFGLLLLAFLVTGVQVARAADAATYVVDRAVYGQVPYATEVQACDAAHALLVSAHPEYGLNYQHFVFYGQCIEAETTASHNLNPCADTQICRVSFELLGPIVVTSGSSSPASAPATSAQVDALSFNVQTAVASVNTSVSSVYSIPPAGSLATAWSIGFLLPMTLYLAAWGVGSVVNFWNSPSASNDG
jgi:hypothetical protein